MSNTFLHFERTNQAAHMNKIFKCAMRSRPCVVLLPTALIKVQLANGNFEILAALIDQGSQAFFITTCAAQMLGYKLTRVNATVSGLGSGSGGTIYGKSTLTIGPIYESNFSVPVDVLILRQTTNSLLGLNTEKYTHLRNLKLADLDFSKTG